MDIKILSIVIKYEQDTVLARQRTRQISEMLGFDLREQTSISTAVSEIVRNAFNYAGGGKLEFSLNENKASGQMLTITVSDEGPGIKDFNKILEGKYKSNTGMGMGIIGSRKLMDYFNIESRADKGTIVTLGKFLPRDKPAILIKDISYITANLSKIAAYNVYDELQYQNQDLLRALEEVRKRQEELIMLNKELEETNRGVVALYAELDEKAEHLKNANDVKARFLSNMSHEFRTPLNSITGLSKILLDRIDGELTEEQEKQVRYIKKSAEDLNEIVNDLLDIAKVEAGKLDVKVGEFSVEDIFAALRGMFKPLMINPALKINFVEPEGIPHMLSDEGKVSQILRNFISNALKFTVRGEINVKAELQGDSVVFTVKDTGVGIAKQYHQVIFEEFTQVENELQKKVKGTGLGLPLSKKLALLLGGDLWLESESGAGSTFYCKIPVKYIPLKEAEEAKKEYIKLPENYSDLEPTLLIIEDNNATIATYEAQLKNSGLHVVGVNSLRQAKTFLNFRKPFAIILDILLPGENCWDFLIWLKSDGEFSDVPVIIASVLKEEKKGLALGAEEYWVKPVEKDVLIKKMKELQDKKRIEKILIIDDEEISRYILRNFLPDYNIIEADSGTKGLETALKEKPDAIFLDIMLPDKTGFEVLELIKSYDATKDIPVIICTSKDLSSAEIDRINKSAANIFMKNTFQTNNSVKNVKEILINSLYKKKEKI